MSSTPHEVKVYGVATVSEGGEVVLPTEALRRHDLRPGAPLALYEAADVSQLVEFGVPSGDAEKWHEVLFLLAFVV